MQLLKIDSASLAGGLVDAPGDPGYYCRQLESGKILFFPKSPVEFPEEDVSFLLKQRQIEAGYHKNIAYRPLQDRVTGIASKDMQERDQMVRIMGGFSRNVLAFLSGLLKPYASDWKVDFASFRPFEEQGRDIKVTSRNDLMHVDAFPTRPTFGDRILRFFVNINPREPRHWITSDGFENLLARFGDESGLLPEGPPSAGRRLTQGLKSAIRSLGVPVVVRSRYDEFMLGFHDYLKLNERFQSEGPKYEWAFPPGSAWMVFTDLIPHAARSGRYALEQTLIIRRRSLLQPEAAPISLLERRCGFELT